MGNHIEPGMIYKPRILPEFCPLEAYKEAEKPEAQPVTAPCYIGQSKVDEKAPSTIILPGMPGLEWMTENLSGHGGTEIDGRTYYTWEEAMAAAEQLGNGWRLPPRDEFVQLDELGSTWDDERKGRWFGGNHDTDHKGSLFLPASGYRHVTTGALTSVGAGGWCWSSSYLAGNLNAGSLYFDTGYVYPLNSNNRAYGFSVRCVRNVK